MVTSRPVAEVTPDGRVVQTFCTAAFAQRHLGLVNPIKRFLSRKGGMLASGNLVRFLPNCAVLDEDGNPRPARPAAPRTQAKKRKRQTAHPLRETFPAVALQEPGAAAAATQQPPSRRRAEPRRFNPDCTSGKASCYCHGGRTRAIYRVDEDGQILAEYCSSKDAADKLGLVACTILGHLNGRTPSVKGHRFRYKLDGALYKRGPKPVQLIDPESGEVLHCLGGRWRESMAQQPERCLPRLFGP